MSEKNKNGLTEDLKSVLGDIADIANDQYGKAKKGANEYLDKHPEYKRKVNAARTSIDENVTPRVKSVTSDVLNASINGMSKLKSMVDDATSESSDDADKDDYADEEEDSEDDDPDRWDVEDIDLDIDEVADHGRARREYDADIHGDLDGYDDDEDIDGDFDTIYDAIQNLSAWVDEMYNNVDVIISDSVNARQLQWLHEAFDDGAVRLANAKFMVSYHLDDDEQEMFNEVYPMAQVFIQAIAYRLYRK